MNDPTPLSPNPPAPDSAPFEGGNLTRRGEVLFLDGARRDAKADLSRPLRRNRPDGLGIRNWLVRTAARLGAQEKNAPLREKAFRSMMEMTAAPEGSLKSRFAHRFIGTDEKGYTHVHVVPLDIDLSDRHAAAIVPCDLIVSELREADEIAIMDFCVCRKTMKCRHHPHDFGCIFTGVGARHVLELGVAHRATFEEAVAHVDRAAELGLMGAADFVEGEQFFWGMRNGEMNRCRMFCFCCDCCCIALNTLKRSTRDVGRRFTPVGWTATVDHDKCTGCRACERRCPQKCISFGPDGVRVTDQDKCLGCGFCKKACRFGAVAIRQTMPMRANLNEYYLNEARIDDGLPHAPAIPSHPRAAGAGGGAR